MCRPQERSAGNGTVRNVGVKNDSEEEVLRHAMTLRSSVGRSTHVKVKARHVQPSEGGQRASPSIQVSSSHEITEKKDPAQCAAAHMQCTCMTGVVMLAIRKS